jgi:hypothetical protein
MARQNQTNAQGLHLFEQREVIATKVAITNAGDGLSQALAIDPVELTIGETVHVVLECEVAQIAFEAQKDTGLLVRKHKLRAGTATRIDKELVHDMLEEQRVKIEQAKGVERLDFPAGDGQADGSQDA